ncbi:hypothetical protein ACIP10_25565 [Streptomyces galbus]|uniref:hypothetical protein n=1 Tax=Streptomyces galbus TaxID=33898 RepID=UPI0037A9940F
MLDRHLARATLLESHRLVIEARTFAGRRAATAGQVALMVLRDGIPVPASFEA